MRSRSGRLKRSLENVNKGSAFFDVKKLDHINGEYIRALSLDEFIELAEPYVYGVDTEITWDPKAYRPDVFAAVAADVQQRVNVLNEIPRFIDWLFVDQVEYDERSWTKAMKKGKSVPEILDRLIVDFADVQWTADALNKAVGAVGDDLGVRSQVPARVAITGRNAGIPMWDATAMLSRDVVIRRLETAKSLLAVE